MQGCMHPCIEASMQVVLSLALHAMHNEDAVTLVCALHLELLPRSRLVLVAGRWPQQVYIRSCREEGSTFTTPVVPALERSTWHSRTHRNDILSDLMEVTTQWWWTLGSHTGVQGL